MNKTEKDLLNRLFNHGEIRLSVYYNTRELKTLAIILNDFPSLNIHFEEPGIFVVDENGKDSTKVRLALYDLSQKKIRPQDITF